MTFKLIQGHRCDSKVRMQLPLAYQWLIVTYILSRTVSKLSHIIVQIQTLDTLRFEPSLGA